MCMCILKKNNEMIFTTKQARELAAHLKITFCHIYWNVGLDIVGPITKIIKTYGELKEVTFCSHQ